MCNIEAALTTRSMQLRTQESIYGSTTLAIPPKIESWKEPIGVSEQEVNGIKASYLLGGKKDKPGSGDLGVAYVYSFDNWRVLATLTEDYLSRPSNADDGWESALAVIEQKVGTPSSDYEPFVDVRKFADLEKSDPIMWGEYPDIAGADLSRILAIASLADVTDGIGSRIQRLQSQSDLALTEVDLDSDGRSFPILEKASTLILQSILQTRNMWRWGILDPAIQDKRSKWRSYWLNAAICASVLVSHEEEGHEGMETKAAFSWARSLADVQLKFDSGAGYRRPFVDADVNAVFDRNVAAKDRNGLTDPRVYGEKTSANGIYMTWGEPFANDRYWREKAWPRADTGEVSFETSSRRLQMTSLTDGLYNFTRDPEHRAPVDEELDWRLSGYSHSYDPGFVLNFLKHHSGFPSDDYFFLQVTQALARR